MRNKKLLSTVVATAMIATMAMPVMAAGDGGSVDVDVTTKRGVLRVQVPTKMAMEIDQFEITQAGSQIACPDAFDMTNYSEMDVRVNVTSTVTVATGNSLVATKGAAEKSTGNDAWLAVAAKTGDASYDDLTTGTTEDPITEDYWALSEENANVTTFVTKEGVSKAEQTFYLSKATGNTEYKLMLPTNNKTEISYAQFYKLDSITTQPQDDDELQAAVDTNDVYVVVTADAGKDGTTVTLLPKGSTVAAGTYAGTNTYYTAADEPTPATGTGAITDGSLYVYAAKDTNGGKAGFRYVGKLSNAKETWTNADISAINIAYTITGVTASGYDDVKNECTYGLYKEKPKDVAPSIETKTYKLTQGQALKIDVNLGIGGLAATGIASITYKNNSGTDVTLATTNYSFADGVLTINQSYVDDLFSYNVDSRGYTIEFNDTAKTKEIITLTTK